MLQINTGFNQVWFNGTPGKMAEKNAWNLKQWDGIKSVQLLLHPPPPQVWKSGRLTIVQFDNKWMVDVCQDVSLHLGSHAVSHWRRNKNTGFSLVWISKTWTHVALVENICWVWNRKLAAEPSVFPLYSIRFSNSTDKLGWRKHVFLAAQYMIHNCRGCWAALWGKLQ